MDDFKSIVLIDDDLDDQEIFMEAFKVVDSTVRVVVFDNGEEALQLMPAMESVPDLMFLDLNMPRMNGMEVLAMLKNDSLLKDIPVVVYTTYYDQLVKRKCSDLGALEILEKPNNFDALCKKIDLMLKVVQK